VNEYTLDSRARNASDKRQIEEQIEHIFEKDSSYMPKSKGGNPISPLDEIKEQDYDMALKKIKSKTREEARPHKKEHLRPQGVPKLNLNALKVDSVPRTSIKSSAVESGRLGTKQSS
jgi:hypothetical protein